MSAFTNPYLRILDEITPASNYIPSKEEYVAWYKKHYKTIEKEPYSDLCLQELIWAFQEFKNLVGFLEHESTIIEANNRYKLLDQESEQEVLEWLMEYEIVAEVAEHFYCSHFEWFDDKLEDDKIIVNKELGIKIELYDFKEFIAFYEAFNPLITRYKEKFCTEELRSINTSLKAMLEFHKIVDFCGIEVSAYALLSHKNKSN